jgi:hypothetical protein
MWACALVIMITGAKSGVLGRHTHPAANVTRCLGRCASTPPVVLRNALTLALLAHLCPGCLPTGWAACPEACTLSVKPVCGEDGMPYISACVAACAGVRVLREGYCTKGKGVWALGARPKQSALCTAVYRKNCTYRRQTCSRRQAKQLVRGASSCAGDDTQVTPSRAHAHLHLQSHQTMKKTAA